MAQVKKHRLALVLCAVLAMGEAHAGPPPAAGIAAEQQGDWAEAARIYRGELDKRPADAALWQRLSVVEARRRHALAAAKALAHAAALKPADAAIQADAARAWSAAKKPQKALSAMQRAVALEPDNADHLLAQSRLANWVGDYPLAVRSLERMRKLEPGRDDILATLARSKAWQGDLAGAIATMRRYLATHPGDKQAWLDLARFQAWRGDYPAAVDVLDDYRRRFGGDDAARAVRARVDAWAGWRHHATALNAPLLEADPEDYQLNYTQALALLDGHVPHAASPYAEKVRKLQPGTRSTVSLQRRAATRIDSWFVLPASYTWDSQGISRLHARVGAGLWLDPDNRLLLDAGRNRYVARAGSPFVAVGGGRRVLESRFRVGLRHAFNRDYLLDVRAGMSHVDQGGGSTWIGSLALLAQPSDQWHWHAALERDRVGISPRAASLGINRNGGLFEGKWRPDLRWTLDVALRHDNYSDDNQRDGMLVSVRRATVRNGWLNLDLGVTAQWVGFEHAFHNGYYSPTDYRRHAVFAGAYVRFTDDIGLQLRASLGRQRDETFTSWRSANDFGASLAIGVFSDWELNVGTAYSQRILQTGAYAGHTWNVSLEHRF